MVKRLQSKAEAPGTLRVVPIHHGVLFKVLDVYPVSPLLF